MPRVTQVTQESSHGCGRGCSLQGQPDDLCGKRGQKHTFLSFFVFCLVGFFVPRLTLTTIDPALGDEQI